MSLLTNYLAPDGSFALLGADFRSSSSPNCTLDAGGKVVHTPGGWAAAGGGMDGRALAVAQSTAAVLSDGGPESFRGVFVSAAERINRARFGDGPVPAGWGGPGYSIVSYYDGDHVDMEQVSTEGATVVPPWGYLGYSVLGNQDTDHVDAVGERLAGATELLEGVRRMAQGAAELTADSPRVSDDILIAALTDEPRRLTWNGGVRELAEATDEALEERAQGFQKPQAVQTEEEVTA